MADSHVQLAGSRRPLPHNAIRVRDVDPHAQVDATVTLKGPALPPPDQMPSETMSREEIDRKYGVPDDQVQKVEDVLRSFGLQIIDIKQGGRSIRVRGSAAAVEAAFQPNMGIYAVPGQGQIRAREGELKVPSQLADVVEGVYGLDQRRVAKRRVHEEALAQARPAQLAPLTPADLVQRYAFPDGTGKGKTIAIAEFGQNLGNGQILPPAYIASDVSSFCASHGLPTPKVRIESVGLTPLNRDQYRAELQELPKDLQNLLFGQTAETMMDAQIVASLCPEADIAIYFATWGEGGWVNLLDEVTSGAGPVPVALSVSYGLAEDSPDWSKSALQSINQRLQIAAMQGITVCVSSGDDGSGCDLSGKRCHVEFPSCSPYVLSVGGTMLTQSHGQVEEVVWWESPGDRPGGGGSTGGGVSTLFARPAWQTVDVTSLNAHAMKGRVVPDVAALAGEPLYDLLLDGKSFPDGGTSASAPLWAALVTRIDASLPAGKQQRFLPPLLYKGTVGKDGFRDITSGDNASHPSPGKGYVAKAGYDAVTGWGVPNGKSLLNALQAV